MRLIKWVLISIAWSWGQDSLQIEPGLDTLQRIESVEQDSVHQEVTSVPHNLILMTLDLKTESPLGDFPILIKELGEFNSDADGVLEIEFPFMEEIIIQSKDSNYTPQQELYKLDPGGFTQIQLKLRKVTQIEEDTAQVDIHLRSYDPFFLHGICL